VKIGGACGICRYVLQEDKMSPVLLDAEVHGQPLHIGTSSTNGRSSRQQRRAARRAGLAGGRTAEPQ
jgi:hypothetical protein